MVYFNTNQEEVECSLDQLYTILADILIIENEVKDDETDDERSVS